MNTGCQRARAGERGATRVYVIHTRHPPRARLAQGALSNTPIRPLVARGRRCYRYSPPPHKHTLIQLTRPSYLGLQASSRRTPTQADSGLKGLTREEAGAAAGAAAAAGRAARGNSVLPLQLASLCLAAFAQANVVTHTGPRTGPRLTTPWRLWQQRVRGGGAGGGVEGPGAP